MREEVITCEYLNQLEDQELAELIGNDECHGYLERARQAEGLTDLEVAGMTQVVRARVQQIKNNLEALRASVV